MCEKRISSSRRPCARSAALISSQSRFTHSWLPEQREIQASALRIRRSTVGASTGTSLNSGSGTRLPPATHTSGIFGGRGSIETFSNW